MRAADYRMRTLLSRGYHLFVLCDIFTILTVLCDFTVIANVTLTFTYSFSQV